MGLLDPMPQRITGDLEPILALPDPRPKISAYHSMPYAIFRYDPKDEFELRAQVGMLQTRLEQRGKRVTRISLAECLDVAMRSERALEDWFEVEREMGTETVVDTVHDVLSDGGLLERLVTERMPLDADPAPRHRLHPANGGSVPGVSHVHAARAAPRPSDVPTVLFYPGDLEGPAGLQFMGVLQAEHNYRSRIF